MIEINNLTSNPINKEFLKRVAKIVLEGENQRKTGISIALVGSGRMRKLNKKYLGKNRVTDILAFGRNSKFKAPISFQNSKLKSILGLGEIVICLREVKKNAKRYKIDFKTELARVLIHGILHLLGYDHGQSKAEAKKMEKKQNYYLKLCQGAI